MTDSKLVGNFCACRSFNSILQKPGEKVCELCFHHGKLVAKYPKTVILLCLVLAAGLGVGCFFVKLDKDVNVDDVYFPQETPIALDRKRFVQMFGQKAPLDGDDDVTRHYFYPHQSVGRPPGFALIITPRSENVGGLSSKRINLDDEAVKLFKEICQQVRYFSSDEISGQRIVFDDVCQSQPGGLCYEPDLCYLDLSDPDLNNLKTEFIFHNFQKIQNGSDFHFSFEAVRLVWFFKSHRSEEVSIFTRNLFEFLSNKYRSRNVFLCLSNLPVLTNTLIQSELSNTVDQSEMSKSFNQSQAYKTTSVPLSFFFYANSERLSELRSQITSSIILFLATVFVMISFAVSTSCSLKKTARWEFTLVLCGVLTVLLTVMTSVGLMACLGIPFLTVSHIIPFLLLGIGIDSAFILINEWNLQLCNFDSNYFNCQKQRPDVVHSGQVPSKCNKIPGVLVKIQVPRPSDKSSASKKEYQRRLEDIIGATMKHGFLSIIISNLTAFVTFAIGAFTIFPVINYTCYYLVCSLGCLLWYESTFFPACLALYTERWHRLESSPMKVLPNNSASKRHPITQIKRGNAWHKVISNGLASLMGSRRVNLMCILLGIVFAFLGMMKCYVTDEFADDSTYLPDSSQTRPFLKMNDLYFSDRFLIQVLVDTPMKIQSETELQSAIRSVNETLFKLSTSRCIEETNLPINWINIVDKIPARFLNLETTNIRETLEFFLRMGANSEKLSFVGLVYNDLKLDNNNTLIGSRVYAISRKYNSTAEAERCVKSLYDLSAESELKLRFCSFELSQWDRNMNMKTYIWRSLLFAIICCSVIVSLFLGKPLVVFGVILTVLLSMLAILGSMAMVGMCFDFLAYITILLSIGLCIDYMAHSGHYYLSSIRLQQCPGKNTMVANNVIKMTSLNQSSQVTSSGEPNKMASSNESIKFTSPYESASNGSAQMTSLKVEPKLTSSTEHLQITSSSNGTSNVMSSQDESGKIASSNEFHEMTSQIASVESVRRMASPLTNAAVSSVIGVVLLHFSDSPPLRFLSHSLAIMFILSFFYSLLFLPSLFRFLDFGNNSNSNSDQNGKAFSPPKKAEMNVTENKLQNTPTSMIADT